MTEPIAPTPPPPSHLPPGHPPPGHPDVEIIEAETVFERFLRMDVFRFRHRLFAGGWSAPHTYDVLRRGEAVAIVLYDPDRDTVVLVEQFRLPALLAGAAPWQTETAAGLVDAPARRRKWSRSARRARKPASP